MNHFSKTIFLLTTATSLLFATLASADESSRAKDFVSEFGNKAISIASSKDTSIDKKRDQLVDLVDSIVDSKWIAKFVLARNYRSASDEQRDRFQKLYRDFMIYTYAPSFKSYNGENFEVLEVIQQGKYFMVKSHFIPSTGPKVNMGFRLKKNEQNNSFSVLDVIAEGVSLIETQRSEFGAVISKKGMEGFLSDLSERVVNLKSDNGK